MNVRRKASPVAVEQSCMSLHRFGTISSKSAADGANAVKSRIFRQLAGRL